MWEHGSAHPEPSGERKRSGLERRRVLRAIERSREGAAMLGVVSQNPGAPLLVLVLEQNGDLFATHPKMSITLVSGVACHLS